MRLTTHRRHSPAARASRRRGMARRDDARDAVRTWTRGRRRRVCSMRAARH